MGDRKIMYVCEECAEHNPEACGRWSREELAVMPDGAWLCENCADEFSILDDHGVEATGDVEDPVWPFFSDFPNPPEYKPT